MPGEPSLTADFHLAEATDILARTPEVLRHLLADLPDAWTTANEGEGTWSPSDVVAHLVHGEKTDWLVRRAQQLLDERRPTFTPFDRQGHREWCHGRTVTSLLDEFAQRRADNLAALAARDVSHRELERAGTHPELGPVTLRQLVAAWVVHDLHHVGQVARVMAKRYRDEVGAWAAYLSVLTR